MSPSNTQVEAEQVVTTIWEMLTHAMEENYIGEDISQLEHALQAANSAASAGCDDETVLAALLHDVGQFVAVADANHSADQDMTVTLSSLGELKEGEAEQTVSVGVHGHELIGGAYLRKVGFSDKVAQLVEAHVNVKRYLTGKNNDYLDTLSSASKMSLKFQGGPFTAQQVADFEASDYFETKVQLRKWDDAAKVVGMVTPGIEAYREMAIKHILFKHFGH
eukprot:gene11577-13510_t